jgi:hypothetical protein
MNLRTGVLLALLVVLIWLGAGVRASGAAMTFERFDREGIAFEYSSSWFVTARPLSRAGNPVYRFAVSTVPIHRTPRDIGPCLPGIARQLTADAVFAYVREAIGSDRARSLPRIPPRPHGFRLPVQADSYLCGFKAGTR